MLSEVQSQSGTSVTPSRHHSSFLALTAATIRTGALHMDMDNLKHGFGQLSSQIGKLVTFLKSTN